MKDGGEGTEGRGGGGRNEGEDGSAGQEKLGGASIFFAAPSRGYHDAATYLSLSVFDASATRLQYIIWTTCG